MSASLPSCLYSDDNCSCAVRDSQPRVLWKMVLLMVLALMLPPHWKNRWKLVLGIRSFQRLNNCFSILSRRLSQTYGSWMLKKHWCPLRPSKKWQSCTVVFVNLPFAVAAFANHIWSKNELMRNGRHSVLWSVIIVNQMFSAIYPWTDLGIDKNEALFYS